MEEEKKTVKGEMLLSDVALTVSRANRRAMGVRHPINALGVGLSEEGQKVKQMIPARAQRQKVDAEKESQLMFLPVINHWLEHGNEETAELAISALLNWPRERHIWEKWGVDSGYTNAVKQARSNPAMFEMMKKALRGIPTVPSANNPNIKSPIPLTENERRLNTWVVEAVELLNKRKGISRKKRA